MSRMLHHCFSMAWVSKFGICVAVQPRSILYAIHTTVNCIKGCAMALESSIMPMVHAMKGNGSTMLRVERSALLSFIFVLLLWICHTCTLMSSATVKCVYAMSVKPGYCTMPEGSLVLSQLKMMVGSFLTGQHYVDFDLDHLHSVVVHRQWLSYLIIFQVFSKHIRPLPSTSFFPHTFPFAFPSLPFLLLLPPFTAFFLSPPFPSPFMARRSWGCLSSPSGSRQSLAAKWHLVHFEGKKCFWWMHIHDCNSYNISCCILLHPDMYTVILFSHWFKCH